MLLVCLFVCLLHLSVSPIRVSASCMVYIILYGGHVIVLLVAESQSLPIVSMTVDQEQSLHQDATCSIILL